MSYLCSHWQRYQAGSSGFVGNGQCAVFVQQVAGAPNVHQWRRGIPVLGNGTNIPQGTVIATFDSHGSYPNMSSGNHAGLFVSEDGHMITMIDQYNGRHIHYPGPSRYTRFGTGSDHNMTADPAYYYVVE